MSGRDLGGGMWAQLLGSHTSGELLVGSWNMVCFRPLSPLALEPESTVPTDTQGT